MAVQIDVDFILKALPVVVNLVIIPLAIKIYAVGRHIGKNQFILSQILLRCCIFNGRCPIRSEDKEVLLWQSGAKSERRKAPRGNATLQKFAKRRKESAGK